MSNHTIAAFYKFTPLTGLPGWREVLLAFCQDLGLKGIILIGHEGINSTVAGPKKSINAFLTWLQKHEEFQGISAKFSECEAAPFRRLRVRIKKEIVTLGVPGIDPSKATGTRIPPAEWNALMRDPGVAVIDARNVYETKVGSFEGALVPALKTFRDFPDFVKNTLDPTKHKRIAMFCTGGIRCEKASAYLISEGFQDVVQLDGGILKYIEEVPEEESLWRGDCFVFDGRMAVDSTLAEGDYEMCPSCRWPVTREEKLSAAYEEGVSCPNCKDKLSEKRFERSRERHKQIKLANARGEKHLAAKMGKTR